MYLNKVERQRVLSPQFKFLFLLSHNTCQVQLLQSSVLKLCSPNHSSVLILKAQRLFFLRLFFLCDIFYELNSLGIKFATVKVMGGCFIYQAYLTLWLRTLVYFALMLVWRTATSFYLQNFRCSFSCGFKLQKPMPQTVLA